MITTGIALLIGTKPYLFERRRLQTEEKRRSEESYRELRWRESLTTELGNERVLVPVTVADETRIVEVKRTSKYSAETLENVVIYRPDDRSVPSYNGKVHFMCHPKSKNYFHSLEGFVSTEYRGRVQAIGWSDECSAERIAEDQEYQMEVVDMTVNLPKTNNRSVNRWCGRLSPKAVFLGILIGVFCVIPAALFLVCRNPIAWQYVGVPKSILHQVSVQKIRETKDGMVQVTVFNATDSNIDGSVDFLLTVTSDHNTEVLSRRFRRKVSWPSTTNSTFTIDTGLTFSQDWIISKDLTVIGTQQEPQVLNLHDLFNDTYLSIRCGKGKVSDADFKDITAQIAKREGKHDNIAEIKVEIM